MENLKFRAKKNVEAGVVKTRQWWTDKYSLPSNHPLFLKLSTSELYLEMYEDAYQQRSDLIKKLKDPEDVLSAKEANAMQTQLSRLNKSLGLEDTGDDVLWDKWEQELSEGKMPDLNEKIEA